MGVWAWEQEESGHFSEGKEEGVGEGGGWETVIGFRKQYELIN